MITDILETIVNTKTVLNYAESNANLHHPCHPPVTEVTQSTYNQNGEFEAGHTRRPPVTEVTQSTYNQNGEFEAAHCRKANLKRHIAARKSPLYLRGWYKGLSFGL